MKACSAPAHGSSTWLAIKGMVMVCRMFTLRGASLTNSRSFKQTKKYLHVPGFRDSLIRNWCPGGIGRLLFFESPGENIGYVTHVIGTDCRPRDAAT
jgi:hypothetical protein